MTFVDPLSLVLDLLILLTVVVFYTGLMVWVETRRRDLVRANTHLQGGALLMGAIGGLIGVIALWGSLTWPITGFPGAESYNLFFFDILMLLSLLLVAFAISVRMHYPLHLSGMLSVVTGLAVLFYGFRAYQLGLTESPLETLLLYIAFGGVAIMAYPATLYLDWFVVGPKVPGTDPLPSAPTPDYPWLWWVLLGIFMLAVFLAGVASVAYGISVVWAHLGSPP